MSGNASSGLTLRGVCRSFPVHNGGAQHVLREIDLTIPAGTWAVVSGPSGAGKSTLLHVAALLDRPDSGQVWVEGREASRIREQERDQLRRDAIGMVFQRFHLLPDRSALENVRLRFRYTGMPRAESRQRARDALDAVGLSTVAERPARLLSGGEMQRVALARALAKPPRILLADEPVGQVDDAAAETILDIFGHLRAQGVAILAAAHGAKLGTCADQVYELREGTLCAR